MSSKVCDASNVTLTVLTGNRPELLRHTLNSLPDWLGLTAQTVVLHNGSDPETSAVLDEFEWNVRVCTHDHILPIGAAASMLMRYAAVIDTEYTLHLEDDWLFVPDGDPEGSWLHVARAILEDHSDVALVRLRQSTEHVLDRNMVTKEPIKWRAQAPSFLLAPNAHYTLNPTLMRTVDLPWPATSELDAARRFEQMVWPNRSGGTAQLVPGVFSHIGGDHSLRKAKQRTAAR